MPGRAVRADDADDLGPLIDRGTKRGIATAHLPVPAVRGVITVDFEIRYRPLRHGDRVMRGLLTSTSLASVKRGDTGDARLDQLRRRGMDGQCAECHTIDREAPGDRGATRGTVVNWDAADLVRQRHGFTVFSHGTHVALSNGLACLSCHQRHPAAQAAPAAMPDEAMDPQIFQPAFTAISRTLCADCHNGTSVTESCTTCHNYHAAETRPVVRNAPIRNAIPSRIE